MNKNKRTSGPSRKEKTDKRSGNSNSGTGKKSSYPRKNKSEKDGSERTSGSKSKPSFAKKRREAGEGEYKRPSGKGRDRSSGTFSKTKNSRRPDGNSTDKRGPKTDASRTGKTFRTSDKRDEIKTPDYNLRPPSKVKAKSSSTPSGDGKIRLNRFIANAGVCSRRDADSLIEAGEITVNGKVVTELGYKVERQDDVRHNGRRLKSEKLVYVLLNKPKDFITTTDDPHERKTVMALVAQECKERIYPVGRLDRNTTGLLLLTNDGELAEKLTHPSHKVKKVYQADLDKPIEQDDFLKISEGLELEDGPVQVDEIIILSKDRKSIGLEIHEGRNRIVRRIFEHLGYEVVKLDRVMYAGLTKKDLPRGKWRYLLEKEVVHLKYFK